MGKVWDVSDSEFVFVGRYVLYSLQLVTMCFTSFHSSIFSVTALAKLQSYIVREVKLKLKKTFTFPFISN